MIRATGALAAALALATSGEASAQAIAPGASAQAVRVEQVAPDAGGDAALPQLTERRHGALSLPQPRLAGAPDVSQLTSGRASVRLPPPPPEAVDLCSKPAARLPEGLDCAAVLEAVAANAPPETRLLREDIAAPSGAADSPDPRSSASADAVARRLAAGDVASSTLAQAVAASRQAGQASPVPPAPEAEAPPIISP